MFNSDYVYPTCFEFKQESVMSEFEKQFPMISKILKDNEVSKESICNLSDGPKRHKERVQALVNWARDHKMHREDLLMEACWCNKLPNSQRIGGDGSLLRNIPRRQQAGGAAWNWAIIDAAFEIIQSEGTGGVQWEFGTDKEFEVRMAVFSEFLDGFWSRLSKRHKSYWQPVVLEILHSYEWRYKKLKDKNDTVDFCREHSIPLMAAYDPDSFEFNGYKIKPEDIRENELLPEKKIFALEFDMSHYRPIEFFLSGISNKNLAQFLIEQNETESTSFSIGNLDDLKFYVDCCKIYSREKVELMHLYLYKGYQIETFIDDLKFNNVGHRIDKYTLQNYFPVFYHDEVIGKG